MPLLFDMPMKQLKTYKGRNPRPADFDAFWDRGLDDMSALDPRVEMKPAAFKTPFADCFHLFFTGVDGSRVHAKLLQPKQADAPHPALLMFHGYSGNSGDWYDKLGYIDVQFLCPRIKAEVFMAVSLMDTVCPPSTQFAAYNKIRSKKSMVLYPDFGHEGLPGQPDRIFQFLSKL